MRFVASFKNPLEMKCVLPPVFDCTGGGDEADNEGEARGYQSDGGSISRREQKGEEQDSGPVCEHDRLQSLVCTPGVTTRRPSLTDRQALHCVGGAQV